MAKRTIGNIKMDVAIQTNLEWKNPALDKILALVEEAYSLGFNEGIDRYAGDPERDESRD